MNFSGERYIPELDAADISYEHWHRYLFASALVKDKAVLDIASGEGYGSSLLAKTARQVTGVDSSLEAVVHASHTYKAGNLEFRQGSVDRIPVPGHGVFDVVVSFETIEHVGDTEQLGFSREAKRLLKAGGFLLISTPDKAIYTDRPGYQNQFHKKEFYRNEFLDFFRPFFRTVCLFSQRVYPVSYIWPLQGGAGFATEYQLTYRDGRFGPATGNLKEGMYLVALCTDAEVAALGPSILIDPGDRKTQIYHEQLVAQRSSIESLSVQLQKQGTAMTAMAMDLTQRENALRDTEARLTEQAARALELSSRVEAMERETELLRYELALQQHFKQLEAKLAARDAELLNAIRGLQRTGPGGPAAAGSPSGARIRKRADRQEYNDIIQRVRRLIAEVVPVNATVAVINKGDPELLRFDDREGWHFPQQYDGQYAGHYPEDSKAAIRELEKVRARGADFLLIPSTALWWLDHYKDFAAHLADHYAIIAREDQTCILYRLADLAGHQVAQHTSSRKYDSLAAQIRAVVDSILPGDATVLILSEGNGAYSDFGKRTTWHFPQIQNGSTESLPADSRAAIVEMENMKKRGAQFLVIPKNALWWLDRYREFGEHLEVNYRAIVRQKHVCHIFDLKGR
jgi:SAM-dependent methyltransferase